MCERTTGAQCNEGKACSSWIPTNPAIGLCLDAPVTCDIYAQDCEPGEGCTLGREPVTDAYIFVCAPAGTSTTGETCVGGCAEGFICVGLAGQTSCRQICQNNDGCSAGACTGFATGWGVTFCL
jgi:hypothetical protein